VKPRTGDRTWLDGRSRTWRWNAGTYEQRDHYDAIEVGPEGLVWYAWNHRHGPGGEHGKSEQSFTDFAANGPLRPLPEAIDGQLRAWMKERGYA
jgi:hypothetical protein